MIQWYSGQIMRKEKELANFVETQFSLRVYSMSSCACSITLETRQCVCP